MPLTKIQKRKIVDDLKEKITRQKAIVFGDIKGIKVGDLTKLRREMKNKAGELKVAKKSLISLALKESGLDFEVKKITGEIALGFGYEDEIQPFKTFLGFSKEKENLKILGGLMNGELIDQERALVLAKLPSREELLSQLFFTVKFPIFALNNILQRSLSILKVKN